MFIKLSISKFRLILLLLIIFISKTSIANCSKEDIDYYLSKGFTTEQVTALCSSDGLANIKEDAYKSYRDEYADEQDEEYLKKMRIERQVFFKSSLGAQNVNIRRDTLTFIVYECAKDGLAKPGSDFNKKGCAEVLVTIKLSEVEVIEKEFKEKVFFGNRQILVKGNVKSKIVGGLEGLDQYNADVLKKKILGRLSKNKGQVLIPIKKGLNFEYALDTFQEIVAFHKDIEGKKRGTKNLGGGLNFDETNEPQDYIIEEDKKKIKLSNDKDEEIVDGTIVFDDLDSFESSSDRGISEIPDDVFN
tara:strand:- start:3811 stop:4719 length:909 start_codon:yes stop_codon:yes gene_type:complete